MKAYFPEEQELSNPNLPLTTFGASLAIALTTGHDHLQKVFLVVPANEHRVLSVAYIFRNMSAHSRCFGFVFGGRLHRCQTSTQVDGEIPKKAQKSLSDSPLPSLKVWRIIVPPYRRKADLSTLIVCYSVASCSGRGQWSFVLWQKLPPP